MIKKIRKEQLCSSCRGIHAIMNDGNPSSLSIENILDSPGYQGVMFGVLNQMILFYLQKNNGCQSCINLFVEATQL